MKILIALLFALALPASADDGIIYDPGTTWCQTAEVKQPVSVPAVGSSPVVRNGETMDASIINGMSYRVRELERKVEGMQKQITILHAKIKELKQ